MRGASTNMGLMLLRDDKDMGFSCLVQNASSTGPQSAWSIKGCKAPLFRPNGLTLCGSSSFCRNSVLDHCPKVRPYTHLLNGTYY